MNKADNLPMSAEEYFDLNIGKYDKYSEIMEAYANYLLSHHINVLSERIKNGATYTYRLKNSTTEDKDGFHFVITKDKIERIAKDYINELNLQSSK